MTDARITAVVIALDEEANVRTLLPLVAWADEVLLVDGGSKDATVELARQGGARVVCRPFDNFAAQRNAALAAATGDWVFFVDADERPTPRLAQEIRLRLAGENRAGYRVPIRSVIFGRRFRFSGTQNDQPLRLIRRTAGSWSGDVHERFTTAGAVGRLDAHLEHITLPTVVSFLGKMQRYTTLAAAARVERGEQPRLLDSWVRPGLELFRRLVWKQGWLDGPEGWAFCGLSALSEWLLARKHRRLWKQHRHALAGDARLASAATRPALGSAVS